MKYLNLIILLLFLLACQDKKKDEIKALEDAGVHVVVSDAAPWWQTTLRALDVVFCALAVAAVVMYVLHTYTDVFSEEKRKNRAAKKN